MVDKEVHYVTKTVTTVRGAEARSIAKWEQQGWKCVSQLELPMFRTQLTFRQVKPKPPWLVIGIAGGVVVICFVVILIMSLITGGDDHSVKPATMPTAASTEPSPEPSAEPEEKYVYNGPQYETVAVDAGRSPAALNQYWIYSAALDTASDAYKDQIKSILHDIARTEGSALFLAEVVMEREIALAESPSTYETFVRDYGEDYAITAIPQKEPAGWIASYAGGFDYNTGEASDSAFELTYWPAGSPEVEKWKPGEAHDDGQ
ncbi:hypothetical protein ASC55_12380 [Microbacterium sp. Root322]|uniref:hypothetical protein n=1 Tax=Microbacterium sp. Root322 TaxID=1736514 RepID=UPI0006FD3679|nr:hypothetical protein [Microbacterium sp. Root322]KQV03016.1 hypothetical protein ASC55_12380 [Microbacterium sp. Root322]